MFELAGSLLLLIVLEIVLGIDNLVFIAILTDRLPSGQRASARRIGLALALIARILLLVTIDAISEPTQPLFFVIGRGISGRDLILFIGGLFLLYKAVHGIHEQVEGAAGDGAPRAGAVISFRSVVTQIVLLDIVFSIDSVITAVGTVDQIWVMITAVMVAIGIMLVVAGTIAFRKSPSVGENSRTRLSAHDRDEPGCRFSRLPYPEGLHLLGDGFRRSYRSDRSDRWPSQTSGQGCLTLSGARAISAYCGGVKSSIAPV